jgi:hypothetical protein
MKNKRAVSTFDANFTPGMASATCSKNPERKNYKKKIK